MWSTGILYILLATMPYFMKRFGVKMQPPFVRIYQWMGFCGVLILLTEVAILIYNIGEPYRDFLPLIPVSMFAIFMLLHITRLFPERRRTKKGG